jgi:hypothetical protein
MAYWQFEKIELRKLFFGNFYDADGAIGFFKSHIINTGFERRSIDNNAHCPNMNIRNRNKLVADVNNPGLDNQCRLVKRKNGR